MSVELRHQNGIFWVIFSRTSYLGLFRLMLWIKKKTLKSNFLTFFTVSPSVSQSTMAFSIQVIADGVILAGAFKLAVLTKKPTRTFCQTTFILQLNKCNIILLCLNCSLVASQLKLFKVSQGGIRKKIHDSLFFNQKNCALRLRHTSYFVNFLLPLSQRTPWYPGWQWHFPFMWSHRPLWQEHLCWQPSPKVPAGQTVERT